MRILVCNDDGIDAPGLAFLADAARTLTPDVWVVGPTAKRSGNGGSVTLHRPFELKQLGPQRFSCSGTATDCVVGALLGLFAEGPPPDLVLGGINDGRNVAEDIGYSGTLGIAREATFSSIPAVAFSRTRGGNWDAAAATWLANLVQRLWTERQSWAIEGHFLSINLPHTLPAPLRQGFVGRDKIANKAKTIERQGDTIAVVTDSSRLHATQPGDENSLVDAGFCCVLRLNWAATTPLAGDALARLSGP